MWIAKNQLTGKTYGKMYSSIYDCANYILGELKEMEELAYRLNKQNGIIRFKLNNFIRPYNVEQKRFACGFDF